MENVKTIKITNTQYEYLERSIKMWRDEKNYKLRNNLMFGVITEIEYILKGNENEQN